MSDSTPEKRKHINNAYHRAGSMIKRTPSRTTADMLTLFNRFSSTTPISPLAEDSDDELNHSSDEENPCSSSLHSELLESIHVTIEKNGNTETKPVNEITPAQASNQDGYHNEVFKQATYRNAHITLRMAARKINGNGQSVNTSASPPSDPNNQANLAARKIVFSPMFIKGHRKHSTLLVADITRTNMNDSGNKIHYYYFDSVGPIRGRLGNWINQKAYKQALQTAIGTMDLSSNNSNPSNPATLPKVTQHYLGVQILDDTQCGYWVPAIADKIMTSCLKQNTSSFDFNDIIQSLKNDKPTIDEAKRHEAANQIDTTAPKISVAKAIFTYCLLGLPILILHCFKKRVKINANTEINAQIGSKKLQDKTKKIHHRKDQFDNFEDFENLESQSLMTSTV